MIRICSQCGGSGVDRRSGNQCDDRCAPAPVLRLTPPVDAADLARTLVSLRPGKRLVVSVDGKDLVVTEAGE